MIPVALFKQTVGSSNMLGTQGLMEIIFPINFAEVLKQENKAPKNRRTRVAIKKNTKESLR